MKFFFLLAKEKIFCQKEKHISGLLKFHTSLLLQNENRKKNCLAEIEPLEGTC